MRSGARGGRRLLDVEGRHPTELAPVRRVVEGSGAVHGGAIVPDHQVADAPRVAVDELRLGRVLDQVAEEEPPLGDRPVDDPGRVRRDVERLAIGARDRPDERVDRALSGRPPRPGRTRTRASGASARSSDGRAAPPAGLSSRRGARRRRPACRHTRCRRRRAGRPSPRASSSDPADPGTTRRCATGDCRGRTCDGDCRLVRISPSASTFETSARASFPRRLL